MYLLLDRWDAEQKRWDLRFGVVASTTANCNRGKGSPVFTPEDFVPGGRKKQTVEDHLQMLTAFTMANGGDVN